MNRETRRKLKKAVKKRGLTESQANAYVAVVNRADEIRRNGVGENTPEKHFEEGDKVLINVAAVKARQNYEKMSENYKEFIEKSEGVVYTAHIEHQKLISFAEEPQWLFWSGDLLSEAEAKAIEHHHAQEMCDQYESVGGNGYVDSLLNQTESLLKEKNDADVECVH